MKMIRTTLITLTLSLPTLAWAAIPVIDRSAAHLEPSYAATDQGMYGATTESGAAAPLSAQAQLFMQLQQMQEEIATLRGMLEEQQHELQQLRQESLERYQVLDSRISSGGGQGAEQELSQSLATEQTAPTAETQNTSAEADPEKEKLYYDVSFELIKQREFEKAQQAFSAFLRQYPNSQYAANAQYWLGEIYLVQGDTQAAGKAFALVSHNYPEHNKVPDALYKLADVERRLGNLEKARGIWQQVVAQYPNSSAAQLSQQDLAKL